MRYLGDLAIDHLDGDGGAVIDVFLSGLEQAPQLIPAFDGKVDVAAV